MAKKKPNSAFKEWEELQRNPAGISIESTENFLKKFPDFEIAKSHLISERENLRNNNLLVAKQTEAKSRGFPSFSALLDAKQKGIELQRDRDLKKKQMQMEEYSAKTRGFSSVDAMHKATIRGQELQEQKHKKYKEIYNDFLNPDNNEIVDQVLDNQADSRKPASIKVANQQTTTPPVSRAEQQSNIKKDVHANKARSNLVDKKAGLSSNLEKVSGSLKPFSYKSIKDDTDQTVEVYSSGNTTHTGQPVKNQITAERKASWDTARELLNEGADRSSLDNSGVNWTKFSPAMINRMGMPGYVDKQRSKPFPEYHQGYLDKDGKYAPLVPERVSHALNPPKLNKGEELSQSVINEDVEKQREEAIKPKPSGGMFGRTSPEEKARLARLDELTAAYHGLNTNVAGSKGSVQVDRVKGLSTKVGTDDRPKIETTTTAPFPTQLTGINNLEGSDLDAFKAAYNQDLELNRIGKQAGFVDLKDSDIYLRDPLTQEVMTPKSTDPWAGSNQRSLTYGYGMGWGNMWRASAKDNAKRAMTVVNPLSRGNMSLMLEQLGRVSTRDMLAFKANPTIMNRLGITAAPAFAAGFVGYGMYNNQDIGEIVSNLAVPALALPGARAGLAVGSFLAPAKTATNFGILRAGSMAVGATVGFVTGASVALAATEAISDLTSNESSIRKFASKMSKTEFLVPEVNSRQSLTARQMALNKLSKSGLNDRALLLGNEAAALGGYL